MPSDQVTIDPEFMPSPPKIGQSRWLLMGTVAAAAFLLGWLLRSPTSGEPATAQAAGSTTTIPTRATTEPIPPSTTTSPATESAPIGLEVPLNEAVPGFVDTVTLAVSGGVWGEEVDIVRWRSSLATPQTILSFRADSSDRWEWFVGLDAEGTWYAVQDEQDLLSVGFVAAAVDEEGWWEPTREIVGLRAAGAVWHETAPGQLAWLSCSRTPGGPGNLYTLDVIDRVAEPLAVARLPNACGETPLWLIQWGDLGFTLEQSEQVGWDEPSTWTVLLDSGGDELSRLEHGPGGRHMVGAGPAGTVWNEEPIDRTAESFLLSSDGRQRTPVPGLAEYEWVEQAEWSPEGLRIALVVSRAQDDRSVIRIVDAATGETTDEINELGPVVLQIRWTSGGRYLLVGHDRDDGGAAGTALVVYDTATAEIAIEEPLREFHDFREIRTFEPSSIALQFVPVEWGIHLEKEWGPGVYTVRMDAEAGPLQWEQIEGFSGKLIWSETTVDLCNIGIDHVGGDFFQVGDTFQTIEGCGANPNAMQEAIDQFGLPETACLTVAAGGVDHEYCAPLT